LKMSGAFAEKPVWEDTRTSRRSFSSANPMPNKSLRVAPILHESAPLDISLRALGDA
jgi:hypothetical protein